MDNLEILETEAPATQENPQEEDAVMKRHREQLEGSRKEAQRLAKNAEEFAFEAVKRDPKVMERVMRDDPKLADKVAKRFEIEGQPGKSPQNAKEFLQLALGTETETEEDKILKYLEQYEEKKEYERASKEVEEQFGSLT